MVTDLGRSYFEHGEILRGLVYPTKRRRRTKKPTGTWVF